MLAAPPARARLRGEGGGLGAVRRLESHITIASDTPRVREEGSGGSGDAQGVGCSVPRGFSRYFVLSLLAREGPLTGKQIIDRAAESSGGIWRPSPGLVYPLLGRLLDDGLVSRDGGGSDGGGQGGRYSATDRGRAVADDAHKVADAVRRQVEVILRLAGAGRFLAADAFDRIAYALSPVCTDLSRMTDGEARDYRTFLESEMARVDAELAARRGSEIPVGPGEGAARDAA